MKFLKWFALSLLCLLILFLAGPRPEKSLLIPVVSPLTEDLAAIENTIKQSEVRYAALLKPDNHARIVWADSNHKNKTPYSIVYLHGFSASSKEGEPLHKDFAKRYGCNLYLPRLYKHGLNEKEPLLGLTAEALLNSAKEAVAVGQAIGDKVILMSTSTGGTLSLYIASSNPDIHGLILYSPNVDLYDPRSFILIQPWGLQFARFINGSPYYQFKGPEGVEKYWTTSYRIEALISLKLLLKETMEEEVFRQVTIPVFIGYYPGDDVVSIPDMMNMFKKLGTSSEQKRKIAFPLAGNHAIASGIWSNDVEGLKKETFRFAEEVLKMDPQ